MQSAAGATFPGLLAKVESNEPLDIRGVDQGASKVRMVGKMSGVNGNRALKVLQRFAIFSRTAYKPTPGRLDVAEGKGVARWLELHLGIIQQKKCFLSLSCL